MDRSNVQNPQTSGIIVAQRTVGFAELVAAGAVATTTIATNALPDFGVDVVGPMQPGSALVYRYLGAEIEGFVPFTGGTISAMAIDVGLSAGDPDALVDAADGFTAAVDGHVSTIGTFPAMFGRSFVPTDTLLITFTATGGNLNALTAGACQIRLTLLAGNEGAGGGVAFFAM